MSEVHAQEALEESGETPQGVEAASAHEAIPVTEEPTTETTVAEAPADDGWGEDDGDAAGFATPTAHESAGAQTSVPLDDDRSLAVTGSYRADLGAWVERLRSRPLAQARQSVDGSLRYRYGVLRLQVGVHAEADLAYQIRRDEFDQPTQDAYQSLVYMRESFAALSLDAVEITFGKQIVAWGEGDVLSPLDVVNPRDLREPGLADLDDLRLPVLSTRVGVFSGYHRFEVMMLHEAFFGFWSPPRGPFSPLPAVIDQSGALPEGSLEALIFDSLVLSYQHTPQRYSWDAQQLLARWVFKGPSVDAALYVASVRDQQGVLGGGHVTQVLSFDLRDLRGATLENRFAIEQRHPRYTLLGHSGATSVGDFLFKWELYANVHRAFNVQAASADQQLFGVQIARHDAVGGMIAATYSGIDSTDVALEMSKAWLLSDADGLLFPFEAPNFALRTRHTFLRDDLVVNVAWTAIGWQMVYGWIARAEASYAVRDGMRVALGYITYQPGDELSVLSAFTRHDRLFMKFRWDFAL